ncbi:MAG: nucleotide sugar dehydrogenase, partial [Candidatus Nitrosothermus koennekii]
ILYIHIMNDLAYEIKNGRAKIAVYGLGQVGSAIAAVWLRKGASVIGIDKSDYIIEEANNGFPNSNEPGVKEAFTEAIKENRFIAIKDGILASKESRIKFVAVPLVTNGSSIDYSNIEEVADSIGKGLKKNDIVCFNTSLPPGTTENIILPKLKYNGLKPDEDFALIYNPERIYVGRAIKDIEENYPAIVSGIGNNSKAIAKELYSIIAKKGVIVMSSIKAAELEKLLEGVYRDVNIALANELARLCDKLGIDFWEVRDAANSQPYCNIHRAGVGVGGICIPIYPRFVLDVASKVKEEANIIHSSRIVNDSMPEYCVEQAINMLNGKKRVAILGLAFRGNVADARLSPSYNVINKFLEYGFDIILHDPYVREESIPKNVKFTRDINTAIRSADLLFIATDHDEYKMLDEDYIISINDNVMIYDGRGIFANKEFKRLKIRGIGRAYETMV